MYIMKQYSLWIVYLIVFINMLGYGIVLPLLPYYIEQFGAGPIIIGCISATYSLFQLVAAPIMGELSDKYGRRPILLISVAGTAISFFMIALARSIPMIFLARVIDGVSGGNISTSQAYIADKTTKQDRTKRMGEMSAAFNLGLFLGPAVGGILSKYGYAVPLFAAGIAASITTILTLFFLPESLRNKGVAPLSAILKKKKTFNPRDFYDVMLRPQVGTVLMTSFLMMFAYSLLQGTLALFTEHELHFSSATNGMIFAYLALVGIFVQIFVFKTLLNKMSEHKATLLSVLCMAVGFALLAMSKNTVLLFLSMTLLGFGYSVSVPMINGLVSKLTPDNEQGNIAGVNQSMTSLARLIAPVVGTAIFAKLGTTSPYITAALILIILWKFSPRIKLSFFKTSS
jgi:DHA1 family tetracycline resistance protein-like MFS transporter